MAVDKFPWCVKNCKILLNACYVYVSRDIVNKTYLHRLLFPVLVKGQNSTSELTGCNLTLDPIMTFYYEFVSRDTTHFDSFIRTSLRSNASSDDKLTF